MGKEPTADGVVVLDTPSISLQMTDVLVLGEGPAPADLMLIAQNPGADEVLMLIEQGLTPRPFVGPAGWELDEYLRQVGISRPATYITNAYKQYTINNERPTWNQLKWHKDFLCEELKLVQPKVIGCIGDCASQWISSMAGQPFEDMASEHGIPRNIWIYGTHFIMVPLFHPAAGLHAPSTMGTILWDFQQMAGVVKGDIAVPTAPEPPIVGGDITDITTLRAEFALRFSQILQPHFHVAIDTEGPRDLPWGLTFCMDGLRGFRIGTERPDLLMEFNVLLHKFMCLVIIQNSLWDIPVLLNLGVDVRDLRIVDTMILAYLLCIEPQGLKPLGWRWLRVKMTEYAEIADPVTEEKAEKYLEAASKIDWDKCPVCGADGELGKKHQNIKQLFINSPEWQKFVASEIFPDTVIGDLTPFTPKGNIKKKYLPYVNWCEGGKKGAGVPLNKKIEKMIHPYGVPNLPSQLDKELTMVSTAFIDDDDIPF